MKKLFSQSSQETQSFAKKVIQSISNGKILLLQGDLGSGKTTFTQGCAQALGISKAIKSPTFTLFKVYEVKNHTSIQRLCHIDAYRIKNIHDIYSLGIEDYLCDPHTLTIIEWPDNIINYLQEINNINRFHLISLEHTFENESERFISYDNELFTNSTD